MNVWRVVGYLFLGFGAVFLALDAITGYTVAYVNSYFAAVSPQTTVHLLVGALTPYATIASFMFVIAAVGLYAARTSYIVSATAPIFGHSSSHPESAQTPVSPMSKEYPPPQVSKCPSCKQTIIFMTEYQKWYCLQEKKYL
ncbi:MAG: hypothetical protein ABSA75_15260 [Candidatus Bathyarchaeia archaeon]|jgi:hypothetical protein